ncbi:helix-turn-helix domain-containing protein [Brevibacillus centrosporus]|jgi:DNA-binding XRE family transcriptional regulator|uniref:helix-turn-helix domain-containing protein n=1 Tax=Brevibacillus centrosporus TaxID=54910 RepID=UPI002E2189EF|nr:helix-turn-helix domain-containing protein [Brevibacillus centrosporus]
MKEFDMKEFAKRLKQEREKKKHEDPKWTQGYVAALLGVARPTYTSYENGTKQPPMETVHKIADLFAISTDYLHGITSDPTPSAQKDDLLDLAVSISRAFHDFDALPEDEKRFLVNELPGTVKWKLEEFRRHKARILEQEKKKNT